MSYRSDAINSLMQSILLDESKDGEFDWAAIRCLVEEGVKDHADGVKTMEQGIVQYLRRHGRSDYTKEIDVVKALLGLETEFAARMVLTHNCGGYEDLKQYKNAGYQFRVAWEKLRLHGDIAYRSHGGWYMTEYGDPNE